MKVIRVILMVFAVLGVLSGLRELLEVLLFAAHIDPVPPDLNKPFDGPVLVGYIFGAAALTALCAWGFLRLRAWSIPAPGDVAAGTGSGRGSGTP